MQERLKKRLKKFWAKIMLKNVLKDFIPMDLDQMRFSGFLQKRAREIEICVQNVAQGKGWRDITQCPVCSSTERKVVFRRFEINIVQCNKCTCGYAEKFPVDTADIYSNADYLPIAQSDYLDNVDYRKQRFGTERLELIAEYFDNPSSKSRLLDAGCGTGWFLELAKKAGYQVLGQEQSRGLAEFTAKRLGIKVWDSKLTKIDKKEQFDVITLFDVIEHVPNPEEIIRSIYSHLNERGIAVFFTPNLDSFGFQHLKEHSSLVMPVEHLFYFTPDSLRNIIERVGLKVVYFATKGMDIPDIYSYYRDEMKQVQTANFLKENCDYLQAMIDASGYANHMRFICKK